MVRAVTTAGVRLFGMIAANSVYWFYLTSKTHRIKHTAPSRLRDREAHIRAGFTPFPAYPLHDWEQRHSKACILIRLMTLVATATLAVAILFRSSVDFRMEVGIVVSVAATTLAVRSLFAGRLAWTLLFFGVLGVFTPFHHSEFSPSFIAVLDMATLALFAASPIIFRKSTHPLMAEHDG